MVHGDMYTVFNALLMCCIYFRDSNLYFLFIFPDYKLLNLWQGDYKVITRCEIYERESSHRSCWWYSFIVVWYQWQRQNIFGNILGFLVCNYSWRICWKIRHYPVHFNWKSQRILDIQLACSWPDLLTLINVDLFTCILLIEFLS